MKVKAYAKLNLILKVLGTREDSYHEIDTIFQAIDLCDIVEVNVRAVKSFSEVNVVCFDEDGKKIAELLERDNLAYKAAILMHDTYHARENEVITIEIEKHIPIAGGLGGGSADAAAVINALCSIWGIAIDDKVYELCKVLGADVAFLLAAQNGMSCARARGVGEKLEYAKGLDETFEIKFSDISIPNKTGRVYSEFDKIKNEREKISDKIKNKNENEIEINNDKNDLIEKFLSASTTEEKEKYLYNDLQVALENITGKKDEGYILCGAGPSYFRPHRPQNEISEHSIIVHTI